ncbi:Uncharacterised protein [Segatella copri]|nr:Uncharacterised protein [Segatella copri]
MHDIQERSIIFVYQNDHLLTRLLIGTLYQRLQTLARLHRQFVTSIDLLVF